MGGGNRKTSQRGKGETDSSGEIGGESLHGLQAGSSPCHGVDDTPPPAENTKRHYGGAESSKRQGDVKHVGVVSGGERSEQKKNRDKFLTILCSMQESRGEGTEKLAASDGTAG